MKAKSIKGKSTQEIQSALKESLAGYKPTVAIVFISIKQDRRAICDLLSGEGIAVLGATSCGEFIDGYQDEGSAAILLLDLPSDSFAILFEELGEGNVRDAATRLAEVALKKFKSPAFILLSTGLSTSGEFLDGEILVRSIEKIIGPQVNIYGGMAGDDATFTGTYVFIDGQETDRGMVALVLNEDKIGLYGMAISGWKPLGTFRTVTKSKGNQVYTIDDQPALEMYLKYLGKKAISEEDNFKLFEDVGIHYPFQVERETGEPVMRTPMAINREENALICDFDVPQGSKIRFSMPPDFDIVETVVGRADELKKESHIEAEALLIFSCAGRFSALGPIAGVENEGLTKVWDAPMAGFFTYGEYGRAIQGRQEFHSTTNCWVALKEKENALKSDFNPSAA